MSILDETLDALDPVELQRMERALRRGCRTWVLRPGPVPMVDMRVCRRFWWK